MSEPQHSSKKGKKKKKSNSSECRNAVFSAMNTEMQLNRNAVASASSSTISKGDNIEKLDTIIDKVLPQKVGMTTKFKDVEVTMTNNGGDVVNGTLKKKKKKKKKTKQQPNGSVEDCLPNEIKDESPTLLNFSENHIELVNHPEISVTISTAPVIQIEEPKSHEKSSSMPDKTEGHEDVVTPANSKKKKKKKKKKKNSESDTVPVPSAPVEQTEDSHSAPTYVKLPADGGNCVLLVSHESFSNGSKQVVENNSNTNSQNKSTVVLKKTETNETRNSTSADHSSVQNPSSVSIFPVYSDQDKKTEKSPEFNVTSSLGKISDMMKNEGEDLNKSSISNVTQPSSVPNEVSSTGEPTKAQLKAERRAKQEAQRAAKLAKNLDKDSSSQTNEQAKSLTNSKEQLAKVVATVKENSTVSKDVSKTPVEREVSRKVQIFAHLPQYQNIISKHLSNSNSKIPPQILELGSHYSSGTLCGSNARCVGFLGAIRQVIIDLKTPPNKSFPRYLESQLHIYLEFLGNCRPLSVSIVNAMKFLKHQVNHIPDSLNDEKAKESLCQSINDYVREEILLAKEAITISASAKIVDNDTILVFAYSSLVKDVLCKAYDENKKFCVIVVDSRAKLEGLEMLRRLVKHGLQCSYISINAVSSVIKKVNKVIIGAHALLANGYVMSRLGCKILSLVGSIYSVPVLVCCETYKFWERALTDSIVHNELGNPDDLVTLSIDKKDSLLNWHDLSSLQIYNLLYDVTPSDFISVVITEKGLIPCTSVPVLLRVKHAGLQE